MCSAILHWQELFSWWSNFYDERREEGRLAKPGNLLNLTAGGHICADLCRQGRAAAPMHTTPWRTPLAGPLVARVGHCPPPAPLVCANHRSTKEHHTPINPHTWLLKKNIAGLAICLPPPCPPHSHVSHFCDQSSVNRPAHSKTVEAGPLSHVQHYHVGKQNVTKNNKKHKKCQMQKNKQAKMDTLQIVVLNERYAMHDQEEELVVSGCSGLHCIACPHWPLLACSVDLYPVCSVV